MHILHTTLIIQQQAAPTNMVSPRLKKLRDSELAMKAKPPTS